MADSNQPETQPDQSKTPSIQDELTAIDLTKGPVRLVTLGGKERAVPENCTEGFGTYHAMRTECPTCPLVSECFCKVTDTPIHIVQVSKRNATKRSKMSTQSQEDLLSKALNPFRTNSADHLARTLYMEFVRRGIGEFDDAVAEKLADNLKLGWKGDTPPKRRKHFFQPAFNKYIEGQYEEVPKGIGVLHGTMTFTGSNGENNKKFQIDLEKAKAALDEIRASVPAPDATPSSTEAPASAETPTGDATGDAAE